MRVFLSCVSTEFKSYRLKLANQLGALKNKPCEVKVQEDFQQGGLTLLDKLAAYVRECDLVIHLVGDACGARPTAEHVRALYHSLGDAPPDPLPAWSYTQWEFRLAQRFERRMLVYFAAADAPRGCPLPVQQTEDEAQLQQKHREAIRQSGKHRAVFTGYNTLVREVFHDLGLESDLKINNLPFKSLGSLFKGREPFLHLIHQTLGDVEHRGHQRFAAITASATAATVHGLGGIGKTRAAIEYAHRYAEEYTALLFVRADSPSGLQQNLAALCGAMVFDLPEKEVKEIDVQVAAVLRWLQQHAGWLLIFDNADTEQAAQAVQELLGKLTPSGQVLVTSRLSNWPAALKSLGLDVLQEADAAAFLLERTQDRRHKTPDDESQAHNVAVELGHLALALEQAGAYIARYRFTFTEYLAEWLERRDKVLGWFDPRLMQYPMSVAVTWQTSFDSLAAPARRLLRMLAWLAPNAIPEWFLEAGGGPFAVAVQRKRSQASTRRRASNKVARAESGLDAREALADLEAHSLITQADETASFTLHPLVQEVTRRSVPGNNRQMYVEAALRWVNAAFVGEPVDVRTWPVLAPLAPHALIVARYADAEHVSDPTARLMNELGVFCHARARYTEGEPLYRRALAIDERAYGPDHPDVARDLNNLAELLSATNRLGEAEPLIRRALAIDERAYGPDHPNVATRLNNLAQLLKATNRLGEAELLTRRALAIDERVYGTDHPDVATPLNNLAELLQDTNRLAEAEPLMQRVVGIVEKAYGPDHPKVATSLNNLATLLQDANRLGESEPLIRRALAIDENSYGPDHYDVARDLNNLAYMLLATNRLAEAEPLMRRALAIDEKAYGPGHPSVARDLNNLAQLLKATNRLNEAEPLMRRHLEIYWKFTRETGHEHPHLRVANNNYRIMLLRMKYTEEQARAKLNEIANTYGFSPGT